MNKITGFLRLARPANIVTAIADILAGITIAGYFSNAEIEWLPILFLILSTTGLYGGGVVFNDVFDAKLDSVERPERPIPSGLIPKTQAALFGAILLLIGIGSAFFSFTSLIIAVLIALSALIYDKYGKHHSFLGPINMGLCRGLNLLLGISIIPDSIFKFGFLAIVPIIYIAAITMISRGEVHGGKRSILYCAVTFYGIVIASILTFSFMNREMIYALPFLLLFGMMIFPPLYKAIQDPQGKLIGKAVKAGVIALIPMNASWAAAFGEIYVAVSILLLLPVSLYLGKLFAVT